MADVRKTDEFKPTTHQPSLVVLVGSVAGKSYPIFDGMVIGRGPEADLKLPATDVSRRHAVIERDSERSFKIRDISSRNGTAIDGTPVKEAPLRYGARIQFGANTVYLILSKDSTAQQIAIISQFVISEFPLGTISGAYVQCSIHNRFYEPNINSQDVAEGNFWYL